MTFAQRRATTDRADNHDGQIANHPRPDEEDCEGSQREHEATEPGRASYTVEEDAVGVHEIVWNRA